MARTLTLSNSYTLGAGDGASGESQSVSFSVGSGLSAVINGSALVAGTEYAVADYLGAGNKAKGIYFENTDATNYCTLKLGTATGGGQVADVRVKAGGTLCLHDDGDAITHIGITANTAATTFVLAFCE